PEAQIRMFIPASFWPGQQGSPGPPHASHVPAPPPLQMVVAPVHVLPAQHWAPTVPHASHLRPAPAMPAHNTSAPLHVMLAHQGRPPPPPSPPLTPAS